MLQTPDSQGNPGTDATGNRQTDALFSLYLWVQGRILSTVLTGRCVTSTMQGDDLKEESTPSAG